MQSVLVLDFGSQYTQLIARRIRELGIYSEILPYSTTPETIREHNPRAIILSGGPTSVYGDSAILPHPGIFSLGLPILGICYGLQASPTISAVQLKAPPSRSSAGLKFWWTVAQVMKACSLRAFRIPMYG